jgi:hypothetical protein
MQRNGSITRVSCTVRSSFPGTLAKSRVQLDERPREDDAQDDQRPCCDEQRVQHVVAEPPRVVFSVQSELLREGRHERRTHRAFRKQIAHEIGDAERDDERVHFIAGAEERGQHLIACKAENAAGERGRAGDAGVMRQPIASSALGALFGSGQRVRFHRGPRG